MSPTADTRPLLIGAVGVVAGILADAILLVPVTMGPGPTFLIMAVPVALTLFGCVAAARSMAHNDLIRVVFPPLVLIIAVLGSILGGITNPTPAAALGAGGAILLAAYRKLHDDQKNGAVIIASAFAVVIMILIGINFDLRINQSTVSLSDKIAFYVARGAYFFSLFGILYSCWILLRSSVLGPVVRETAKVTSMVFTILIGSQILNLVLISFGGEHYIQSFLRSFEQEWTAFLIVMLVLFVLGFVLDFLEIIYIVVPIVGPVIYGGTYDPSWVTIMITVNLQTSFLTPPFGFALFYLRGVAPASVTTGQIYRGDHPLRADPGDRARDPLGLPGGCDHRSGSAAEQLTSCRFPGICKTGRFSTWMTRGYVDRFGPMRGAERTGFGGWLDADGGRLSSGWVALPEARSGQPVRRSDRQTADGLLATSGRRGRRYPANVRSCRSPAR